jgi:hypothetical protein
MPPYTLAPVTVEDGPAIGRNNVSAFWRDSNWHLMWSRIGKSEEYVISQAERRWAWNLIKDPYRRSQKAIDTETGELVGFAHWILPKESVFFLPSEAGGDTDEEAKVDEDNEQTDPKLVAKREEIMAMWPEGRVILIDEEARAKLQEEFNAADWELDHAMDTLDPPVQQLREKLRKKHHPYISKICV